MQCEQVPVRIIGQILHCILTTCTTLEEDSLVMPEEHLELLQELLRKTRQPIKRRILEPGNTTREEHSQQGDHVMKFMRRQTDGDALRVAALHRGGIIKEHPDCKNESLLLGEVAGDHGIGPRLQGGAADPTDSPRPLTLQEAAQWELHLQEEEEEAEQAALALEEERTPTSREENTSDTSADSHRNSRGTPLLPRLAAGGSTTMEDTPGSAS